MKRWPEGGLRALLARSARTPEPPEPPEQQSPPAQQERQKQQERLQQPAPSGAGPRSPASVERARDSNAEGLPLGLLQRLESAIQAQRDFVADAAHALRSPLTALKLQLQLAERANDPAARAAAFAKVHERLDRANHLVHQLLTLAHHERVDAVGTERVDLVRVAERVVIELTPLATSRGIDLGLEQGECDCRVQGDADQLTILLSNLVDNALRHTPSGGHVDIQLSCDSLGTLMQVCDSGPGVPPQERERVFDRFYRGAGAKGIGSGLGLAIVRVIADRHGARVSLLESRAGGLRVDVRFRSPQGRPPA